MEEYCDLAMQKTDRHSEMHEFLATVGCNATTWCSQYCFNRAYEHTAGTRAEEHFVRSGHTQRQLRESGVCIGKEPFSSDRTSLWV